jgi:trimeric autotransporter adhesin
MSDATGPEPPFPILDDTIEVKELTNGLVRRKTWIKRHMVVQFARDRAGTIVLHLLRRPAEASAAISSLSPSGAAAPTARPSLATFSASPSSRELLSLSAAASPAARVLSRTDITDATILRFVHESRATAFVLSNTTDGDIMLDGMTPEVTETWITRIAGAQSLLRSSNKGAGFSIAALVKAGDKALGGRPPVLSTIMPSTPTPASPSAPMSPPPA